MRRLLILAAAAAVSAACHSRSEDEVGAAPDQQADTAATAHVIDSTRTGPPGVGGRPGDATVTPDSVGVDSALTNQENAGTPGANDTTLTATPQDTLGPRDTGDTTMTHADSTMNHGDSTMVHGDSAMTGHAAPDTAASQ
jgi:hypothetical protein